MLKMPQNELEAWTAGMILADGCAPSDGRPVMLTQKSAALPQLQDLVDYFDGRGPYERSGGGFNIVLPPVPRSWKKTVLPFSPLSDLGRHYWRGVFDGDGAISAHLDSRGQGLKLYMRMSFFWAVAEVQVGSSFTALLDHLRVQHGHPKCNSNSLSMKILIRSRSVPDFARYLYEGSAVALPWKQDLALADPAAVKDHMTQRGVYSLSGYRKEVI